MTARPILTLKPKAPKLSKDQRRIKRLIEATGAEPPPAIAAYIERGKVLPLAVGVNEELTARLGDADAAGAVLAKYCRLWRYVAAVAEGGNRHDLDGNPVARISDADRHRGEGRTATAQGREEATEPMSEPKTKAKVRPSQALRSALKLIGPPCPRCRH